MCASASCSGRIAFGSRFYIWGIGFDTSSPRENCFGLDGIRQRARILGGKCSIRSKMGEGTRVLVELPVVVRGVDHCGTAIKGTYFDTAYGMASPTPITGGRGSFIPKG